MQVDQAIYTSLARGDRAGYHVVSRSPGVTEAEARALAAWSPSQDALLLDVANRISVNYHPLAGARFALSRTCRGLPEYSGRGGHQVYTHALIFDPSDLAPSIPGPLALYRDAMALGLMRHRAEPEAILNLSELGRCHRRVDPGHWEGRARELGLADLPGLLGRLSAGEPIQLPFAGDRTALAECLLGCLPATLASRLSFSTSLRASPGRPFGLSLVN